MKVFPLMLGVFLAVVMSLPVSAQEKISGYDVSPDPTVVPPDIAASFWDDDVRAGGLVGMDSTIHTWIGILDAFEVSIQQHQRIRCVLPRVEQHEHGRKACATAYRMFFAFAEDARLRLIQQNSALMHGDHVAVEAARGHFMHDLGLLKAVHLDVYQFLRDHDVHIGG